MQPVALSVTHKQVSHIRVYHSMHFMSCEFIHVKVLLHINFQSLKKLKVGTVKCIKLAYQSLNYLTWFLTSLKIYLKNDTV